MLQGGHLLHSLEKLWLGGAVNCVDLVRCMLRRSAPFQSRSIGSSVCKYSDREGDGIRLPAVLAEVASQAFSLSPECLPMWLMLFALQRACTPFVSKIV